MDGRTSHGCGQEEEKIMVARPHTYAEWVSVLDAFKNKTNDTQVLSAMQNGTIEWQSGIADRFMKRLLESLNARLNAATDKFQKDSARAGMSEGAIVQALSALRRELAFLEKAVDIPALPEKERNQIHQIVIDQADQIQKSLEDSARKDRSGKLASIVRNTRVNKF